MTRMQLWLARDASVTLREQLATQIVLGILAGDLPAGQRLPSTRELARRYRVHANTVSAAYRDLEQQGWLEFRHGSGVYVRSQQAERPLAPSLALDHMIASLFRSARELGIPLVDVRARLRQWVAMQPPDHFLLIEPDAELAAIVVAEMQQGVHFRVEHGGLAACRDRERLAGAIVIALPSKYDRVRRALPPGAEALRLQVRSVPASLASWLPAKPEYLVGVASRWPGFLQSARTMLIAAGFARESLVVRDGRTSGWRDGLAETAAVVCDALIAQSLPKKCRAIVFPLLAPACLEQLRRAEQFSRQPLTAM